MKRLHWILVFAALPCLTGVAADTLDDRVVEVLVTHQQHSPFYPWQTSGPARRAGYGVLINEHEVLTTEPLVRNATLVELRKARSGAKLEASVVIADPRAGLALLRVASAVGPSGPVLDYTGWLTKDDGVDFLQFNDIGDSQSSRGRVTQMSVARLPNAPHAALTYRLVSDLQIESEGVPAFKDGKLAGIVTRYEAGTRIASLIAGPTLNRFMEDARHAPYLGPATAGFTWRSLIDPRKREYLGLQDEPGGVLVLSALSGSGAADALEPLDVIIEWDGFALDNQGYYEDPELGRLNLAHLIKGKRWPGDVVPLVIMRQGLRQTVQLELGGDLEPVKFVPENVTGEKVDYLVSGGFVIRELDVNYLRAHGGDWRSKVDPRLLHLYTSGNTVAREPGDRVVLLSSVLPDPINMGYHELRSEVITSVNGRHVRNMADVFSIAKQDGAIHRVRVHPLGVDLVLDRDSLSLANERLAARYRIPSLRYRTATSQPN